MYDKIHHKKKKTKKLSVIKNKTKTKNKNKTKQKKKKKKKESFILDSSDLKALLNIQAKMQSQPFSLESVAQRRGQALKI